MYNTVKQKEVFWVFSEAPSSPQTLSSKVLSTVHCSALPLVPWFRVGLGQMTGISKRLKGNVQEGEAMTPLHMLQLILSSLAESQWHLSFRREAPLLCVRLIPGASNTVPSPFPVSPRESSWLHPSHHLLLFPYPCSSLCNLDSLQLNSLIMLFIYNTLKIT